MLDTMKRVFERIDDINNSFQGMSPRNSRRQKQQFANVLHDLEQTPASGGKVEPGTGAAVSSADGPPNGGPAVKPSKIHPQLNPLALAVPASKGKGSADFSGIISQYAGKYNLDPQLVQRVIEVESNNDPTSVSSKGAIGLMQLMPDTAREMGVVNPFDPEQNIAGGARYLSQLLQQSGGDLTRALAAYNAGPGAVREYGGVPPFPETKNYIRKVMNGLPNKGKKS